MLSKVWGYENFNVWLAVYSDLTEHISDQYHITTYTYTVTKTWTYRVIYQTYAKTNGTGSDTWSTTLYVNDVAKQSLVPPKSSTYQTKTFTNISCNAWDVIKVVVDAWSSLSYLNYWVVYTKDFNIEEYPIKLYKWGKKGKVYSLVSIWEKLINYLFGKMPDGTRRNWE